MATRWLAGLEPAGRRLCPANAANEWSAALRIPISGMLFADWLYRSALSRCRVSAGDGEIGGLRHVLPHMALFPYPLISRAVFAL